jgi:hypothetical protein
MNKHAFRPSLNDVLEHRIALSHLGSVQVAVAHPKPTPKGQPILKSTTLNDVNHKIDQAFSQFNKEYTKEVAKLDHTRNEAKFQSDLGASVKKLETSLDKQAARIPGGPQNLAPVLNARVDSLVKDLKTDTSISSTNLIQSDRSGAHADVSTYVHDEVAKGDFSVK